MTRSIATTPTVAVAADYAEAMLTARRCRSVLFFLLLLILLGQIAIFFVVRYVPSMSLSANLEGPADIEMRARSFSPPATQPIDADDADAGDATSDAGADADAEAVTAAAAEGAADADDAADDADAAADDAAATTEPTTGETARPASMGGAADMRSPTTWHLAFRDVLRYVIPVTNFLGIVLAILLSVVLLLIVMIMLVGRLIGVSGVTSAFVWSVFLLLLLFPWQAFLISEGRAPAGGGTYAELYVSEGEQPAFKFPGVLYTYPELREDANFRPDWKDPETTIHWMRFVILPGVAVLLLLMVQAKSGRGLRMALGESDVHVSVNETGM